MAVFLPRGPQAHPALLTTVAALAGLGCRQAAARHQAAFPDTTCSRCGPARARLSGNDSSVGQVCGSSPGRWAREEYRTGHRSALTGRILPDLFLVAQTVGQSHGIHSRGRGRSRQAQYFGLGRGGVGVCVHFRAV